MSVDPRPTACPICQQPSDQLSPDGYCLRHESQIRGDASARSTAAGDRARTAWSSTDAPTTPTSDSPLDDAGHPRQPSRQWRGLTDDGKPIRVSCWDQHGAVGLCQACLHDFGRVLSDVPYLLDDLDVAIAGNVTFVDRGQRRDVLQQTDDTDNPTAGQNPAVNAHQRLARALAGAAPWFDAPAPELLALQLLRHLTQLADEPALRRIAQDLTAAASRAHRVIDRPADLYLYGPCPQCGTSIVQDRIHADDQTSLVRCRQADCDYQATLADHNATQLALREDSWLTLTELVGALATGGVPVTRDQIKGWADREGLPREKRSRARWIHGHLQHNEVWAYRVGDVRDLAARAAARRERAVRP